MNDTTPAGEPDDGHSEDNPHPDAADTNNDGQKDNGGGR